MKKILLTTAVVCASMFYTQAQYYLGPNGQGNPNEKNTEDLEYPSGSGLPGDWSVVLSGGNTNPAWSTVQTIPFSFNFNNNSVSQFKVSSSGVLTFSTGQASVPGYLNSALPHSSIPDNSVCVWGIAGTQNNDNIVRKTFGTAPNRQLWISFNDYSLPAVFNSHFTYWSIVLEETSNQIYIVDQRTSNSVTSALTLGIQVNDTLATTVAGSPAYNSVSNAQPTRADNQYYTFIQGIQPDRDVRGISILIDDIIASSEGPKDIRFVLQNQGADTVTSLDLNYSYVGGLKTSSTITNLFLLPWKTDTVSHPQAWSPTVGKKILKVWSENINGAADENPLNDTVIRPITVLQNFAVRTPVIESFTSSTSPQSKNSNDQLQNTLANQSQQVVHVKYPMSWPGSGDPYYTTEAGSRRQYYGITTVPTFLVDANDWSNFNYMVSTSALNSARAKRSLLNMSATFWQNGQEICAEVTVNPLVDLSESATLYIVVYEKSTTGNVKNSGESTFYNVMKKMLPNENGTPISGFTSDTVIQTNACFTFNGSYVLPPNANSPVNLNVNHTIEDFSNLGVAAWVQNDNTLEILQATMAQKSIGLSEVNQDAFQIDLFPNPAQNEVFVRYTLSHSQTIGLSVLDMTGKTIWQSVVADNEGTQIHQIPTSSIPAGVYFVQVSEGNSVKTKKLIIQ